MKKLPVLVTICVALIAGGYFLYDQYFKKPSLSVWDLISSEAILVYESSACFACMDEVKKTPILAIIREASFSNVGADSLQALRELVSSADHPGKLISLHLTKKDEFDFVYYIPKKYIDQHLPDVIEKLKGIKNVKFSERDYQGIKIHEIFYQKKTFSWIESDNYFAGTFTPVLIEDVVRNYHSTSKSFKDELAEVYRLPRIKNDGGNLYIHLNNFSKIFSLFSNESPPDFLTNLAQSALLDVKVSDNKFILNGFSIDSSASRSNFILSSFNMQSPVAFTLKQFISNRAIMVTSYGISDGQRLSARLLKHRKPQSLDTLAQLEKALRIDLKKLYDSFSGEIGIAWQESRRDNISKILMIHSEVGVKDWLKTFEILANNLSIDTVFYESYSNYDIREVPVFRFPEKLFYPLVSGFDNSYYTVSGNTIFIADDLEELKQFLNDIDREETWGKSVAQNRFLEGILLESNVNLFINTPKVWNALSSSLHPRWKKFIKENENTLNVLGMGAIQFSHLNDSYYTNVSWAFDEPRKGKATVPLAAAERNSIIFPNALAKVFLVKSHVDKSEEILLQDSLRRVSLVSKQGKVQWTLSLDDFITSDVFQIDYVNNGKLQYFFTTPGKLHVVDRLGNHVSPYPVSIREQEVEFVSIVDYDHNKKYRFLISGKSGALWIYDKEGTNLEGWQPRDVEGSLSAPARHHRILGKDYMLAIRDDGKVYLMNRRGEVQKSFPLDLQARPTGEYFIESGRSKADTYIVVISRDGFRVKFNLEGKVQSREALVKTAADSRFKLISEKDAKSYLILRQDARQFSLLDKDLNTVLTNEHIGNNPVAIQYQNFGGGKSFITITDLSQDLSFVYDGKGNLLTPVPIESSSITMYMDAGKPSLLYSLGNSVGTRGL